MHLKCLYVHNIESQLLLLGDFCPSSGLEEASVYFLLVFPMIVLLTRPVTPTLFIVNVQLTIILKGGDGFFTIAIPQCNPNPKKPNVSRFLVYSWVQD